MHALSCCLARETDSHIYALVPTADGSVSVEPETPGFVDTLKNPTTWSSLGANLIGIAVSQAMMGCPISFALLITGLALVAGASALGAAKSPEDASGQLMTTVAALGIGLALGALTAYLIPDGVQVYYGPIQEGVRYASILFMSVAATLASMALFRLTLRANDPTEGPSPAQRVAQWLPPEGIDDPDFDAI